MMEATCTLKSPHSCSVFLKSEIDIVIRATKDALVVYRSISFLG
jgi:hypothetical protein